MALPHSILSNDEDNYEDDSSNNVAHEIGLACIWATGYAETPEAVRAVLRVELPATSVPRHVCALPHLPMDQLAGKCDRLELVNIIMRICNVGSTFSLKACLLGDYPNISNLHVVCITIPS